MNNAELKEKIEQMEKELNELKKAVLKQEEPKFERTDRYFCVGLDGKYNFEVIAQTDVNSIFDNYHYDNNNYFHIYERAEEVAEKIKLLLKLERLHDTFCPDFVPDLNNTDYDRYGVYYDVEEKAWRNVSYSFSVNPVDVYFSTKEIAQKVCDILNSEKENENE